MANQKRAVTAAAVSPSTGWIVTLAGTGVNLALGILYTWSVISAAIPKEWGWSEADKSWPYSIALLVFAFTTIPAGRMQDRIGPRWVATIGGLLVGIGFILASLTTTPLGFVIGFGILAGAGIGFGYASATPPAVKWFSAAKTGLIAGIVVSGFGLASVYAAPTAQFLASTYGLPQALVIFGIAFFVVVVGLAQLMRVPPAGYVPPDDKAKPGTQPKPKPATVDVSPSEMLRKWQFYVLWFIYAVGAGAGLMIISKMSKITTDQAGLSLGFVLVAVLAIGNGGGRILAGMLSDKIGRLRTLLICLVVQAVLMLLLSQTVAGSLLATPVVLGIMAAIIGGNYGSNLAVFPAITKDWFGLRNFGANYGFVFTAWGVGGFVLSLIMGSLYDATHSFTYAYFLAAALLLIGAGLTFVVRAPVVAGAEAGRRAAGQPVEAGSSR